MTAYIVILVSLVLIVATFLAEIVIRRLRASEQRRRKAVDDFFKAAEKLRSTELPQSLDELLQFLSLGLEDADWAKVFAALLEAEQRAPRPRNHGGKSKFRTELQSLSPEQLQLFVVAMGAAVVASCERSLFSGRQYRELIVSLLDAVQSSRKSQTVIRIARESTKELRADEELCVA